MTNKVFEIISSSDIFCSADKTLLRNVLSECGIIIKEYKKDQVIFSVDSFSLSVGIILKGSAKVSKKENGVLISTLEKQDIFGCASLFASRDYYVNSITALKDCRVAFIEKATVEKLMLADPGFSISFIKYLSDRLYYLNSRILTFTGTSTETRLANYLYGSFEKAKSDSLSLSLSQVAFSIDVARASLYRALDKLCESGAIEKEGKIIRLINEQKLKSFMSQ